MRPVNKIYLLCFLIIVISFSSLIGCTQEVSKVDLTSTPLTIEEKLEDFEYMYKIISENYPFLKVNERLNGVNWLENKEKYKSMIAKSTTDVGFMGQISKITRELNNNHTHVVDKESFKWYYSIYTESKYNKPWGKVFTDKNVLEHYNFDKSQIPELKSQGYFGSNTSAFKSIIIEPDDIAYVKINQMNGGIVTEDGIQLREFYQEIKDYNKLIIDIRGNTGGNDLYWMRNVIEPLASEPLTAINYIFTRGNYGKPFYKARRMKQSNISKLDQNILDDFPEEIQQDFDYYQMSSITLNPVDSIKFQGDIYLLVDRVVYSSSESFASFCKQSGFATLIGETTGGDGIGIDPLFFSLPNSGIVIRFSSLLALNGDGTINEEVKTPPHIIVNPKQATLNPRNSDDIKLDESIQYIINNI